MAPLVIAALITLVSLVSSQFLPDRFRLRKVVALVIGILGAAWSFAQGYWSLERGADLDAQLSKARAETQKIRERISTRHFTGEQMTVIANSVRKCSYIPIC